MTLKRPVLVCWLWLYTCSDCKDVAFLRRRTSSNSKQLQHTCFILRLQGGISDQTAPNKLMVAGNRTQDPNEANNSTQESTIMPSLFLAPPLLRRYFNVRTGPTHIKSQIWGGAVAAILVDNRRPQRPISHILQGPFNQES